MTQYTDKKNQHFCTLSKTVLYLYPPKFQLPEIWTRGSSLANCSGPNSDCKVTLCLWEDECCSHAEIGAWSLPDTNQFFLFEDSWWSSCSIAQLGSCTNKQSIYGTQHRSRKKNNKKRYDWTTVKRSDLALSEPVLTHMVNFNHESECDLSVQAAATGLVTGLSCSRIAFTL